MRSVNKNASIGSQSETRRITLGRMRKIMSEFFDKQHEKVDQIVANEHKSADALTIELLTRIAHLLVNIREDIDDLQDDIRELGR